ncbi:ATP-binding cassette domain-containing protein [Pseudonocardia sp. CA-107938]|uniref:ATP-binding cassette domain-containing protein n=1 Tax=Pseudonocardia sp. CA-107938 TaxID=3240021 RepID=UPI003D8A005F
MQWELDAVSVAGAHAPLLHPTSLALSSGQVQLAVGPAGAGHTALALAAAGRIKPSSGRVLIDGQDAPAQLRRAVAIVDAPGVSEPDDALPLATVIGEELAMARRRAGRGAVHAWLSERSAGDLARTRYEEVPAAVRLRLMVELAAARPGVRALVLTSPDRHGIPPALWWDIALNHAGQGLAVLVTAQEIAGALLDAAPALIGANQPGRATTVLAVEPAPVPERNGS